MATEKYTLSNGVRVLIELDQSVMSAAVGLWCQTGSRNELENEAGLTHFIEHMLFKGTPSRTAKQIAEAIEGRGGMLNAFTDKEMTCYYCRVLADDVSNGIDVLSDMMTHSLMDQEEIDRECGVILEEIKRSEDEPGDHVHELHIEGRWGSHPLGKPIIGTAESVRSFQRDHFVSYMDRQYRAGNIVLGVAGRVDVDALLQQAESVLGSLPSGGGGQPATQPENKVQSREIGKDVEQVHFCIGTESCSLYDPDLYTFAVLDGVLGSGMSSRLFQEVRERRGLVYSIGSYNLSYTGGGLFTVYGGTGAQTWGEVQSVVKQEFLKISTQPVPEEELQRVKRSIAGNMVLALESLNARMSRMVKNELNHNRIIPLEETLDKINRVTNDDLIRVAERIFAEDRVSITAIGPF
ncbi:MAG: insulinase family protein [Chthonomonas sp.]|nr:insulinase family protein [Chthonomonas sp.]